MKKALLINPADDRYTQEVVAGDLTPNTVHEYRRLGLQFACACLAKPYSADRMPPPMVWRRPHRMAGQAWVQSFFAAAAGTVDQHARHCQVRIRSEQDEKASLPHLSFQAALAKGYPVVAFINADGVRHPPYRFDQHHQLDQRYDGLRLTRKVPALHEVVASIDNQYRTVAINDMSTLIKTCQQVVDHQGSLSGLLISRQGGVRSLPQTYFNPLDSRHRTQLASEASRVWQAIGCLQEGTVKNAMTKMALHPLLMEVIPSKDQQDFIHHDREDRSFYPRGSRRLMLRGSGGPAGDRGYVLSHDLIFPDVITRNQVEEALQKAQPVYAMVTPVVQRGFHEKELPHKINLSMHVIPGLCHVGALPPVVDQALRATYRVGDWRRLIDANAREDRLGQVSSVKTPDRSVHRPGLSV